MAGGARRKPSEQGSARKAPRADAARPLRTALRPPNPQGFFDRLPFIGDAVTGRAPGGGGGVWLALRGLRPPRASQTKARGQGPSAPGPGFQGALRPAAAPPGAPALPPPPPNGRAAGKAGRTGRGPGLHRGAKPLPTAYGQRRRERMAAGGRPGAATALGARISPCAQHRRAGSTAVRAAPPCAQHGQIFMHTSQARQITVRRLPTDLASPTRCTLREAGKRGLGS